MRIQYTVIFSLILAVATTSTLFAAPKNCSSVTLPLERIGSIRNQGISGLCFAYEAADLVSYKLGVNVSAIGLALFDFKKSKHSKIQSIYAEGGDSLPGLKEGARQGFCLERDIPSEEDRVDFSSSPHAKIFDSFTWLEEHDWKHSEAYSVVQSIFPRVTEQEFSKALSYKNTKRRFDYLQQANCKERARLSDFELVIKTAKTPSQIPALLREIDLQLERNNLVGIGFSSNDLYIEQDVDDSHATSIVGRRWNAKEKICEYLMRDSFGAQCKTYQQKFDCAGGYIWLNENFLLKNLSEVEYLL